MKNLEVFLMCHNIEIVYNPPSMLFIVKGWNSNKELVLQGYGYALEFAMQDFSSKVDQWRIDQTSK